MSDEELAARWESGAHVEVVTIGTANNVGAQSAVESSGIVDHTTTGGNAVVIQVV